MTDDSVTVSDAGGRSLTWGSLEILEEVGRGGFGVVYRAWEPALEREVALKVIRPREPNPEALASILREGQLLARVRHPNVVSVHGAQQIGDEVGLWMEFLKGRSLSALVKEDGPRAAGEAAVIGISLCQATAAVHKAGVLHRDIKAQNVMREAGGRIVLMDFGAGQMLDGPRRAEQQAIGTPAYMAPEVIAGGRATARSDVYSLGVLMYYLVTGTYPIEGHTWTDFLLAHGRFERRPLGDIRPDIDVTFVRVVERATALHSDERYATPGAMLTDLTGAATGKISNVVRRVNRAEVRRPRTPEPKPGPSRWLLAAAIAVPICWIWALGAITTIAFNNTLSRSRAYSGESVLYWWSWGFAAIIPGAIKATFVVLVWLLLAAVWRLLTRLATPAADLSEVISRRWRERAARVGLTDPDTDAQLLLAGQIVVVALWCWYFRDILGAAAILIEMASPQELEALRPDHFRRHQWFDFSMAILILAMSLSTYRLFRMRQRANGSKQSSMAAILGVIGVSFIVWVFPYRLLWHNRFELASYDGQRCYILGDRSDKALLYCPNDVVPKVKEVALPNPGLKPSGNYQNIYAR